MNNYLQKLMPSLATSGSAAENTRAYIRANATAMLRTCEALSCPLILSSDSHGQEHVGEVTEALKLLRELGFPKHEKFISSFMLMHATAQSQHGRPDPLPSEIKGLSE